MQGRHGVDWFRICMRRGYSPQDMIAETGDCFSCMCVDRFWHTPRIDHPFWHDEISQLIQAKVISTFGQGNRNDDTTSQPQPMPLKGVYFFPDLPSAFTLFQSKSSADEMNKAT